MAFTYSVTIDREQKMFHLTVAGNLSDIEYVQFIKSYNREISYIDPREYVMVLDYTNFNIEEYELLPELKESYYHLFTQSGFIKVIFTNASKSPSSLE